MPFSKSTFIRSIDELCALILQNDPQADVTMVQKAYAFADEAHKGQIRASGEPYIMHPLQTAATLAEMQMPVPIIIGGLLHDVPEDTKRTIEEITKEFGEGLFTLFRRAGCFEINDRMCSRLYGVK